MHRFSQPKSTLFAKVFTPKIDFMYFAEPKNKARFYDPEPSLISSKQIKYLVLIGIIINNYARKSLAGLGVNIRHNYKPWSMKTLNK